ncbi:MAG: bestrophin-like domain [Candidatus Dormibacteria bacterium]
MPDITGYPVELVVGAVVLLSALYAAAGVLIGRRLIGRRVREGHNDVAAPIFATVGVIYAVVLGFLVILVWTQFDSAHSNASDEASTLTVMYRLTDAMPQDQQKALRPLLHDYTENVVNKEWDAQAGGESSPEVDKALSGLYAAQRALPPDVAAQPANTEFLKALGVVTVDRNRRILASQEQLDPLLWVALVAGQLLTVGLTFLVYAERRLVHVISSVTLSVFIGLLLSVALVLDNPFAGQLGVSPEAFDQALTTFSAIDNGGQ